MHDCITLTQDTSSSSSSSSCANPLGIGFIIMSHRCKRHKRKYSQNEWLRGRGAFFHKKYRLTMLMCLSAIEIERMCRAGDLALVNSFPHLIDSYKEKSIRNGDLFLTEWRCIIIIWQAHWCRMNATHSPSLHDLTHSFPRNMLYAHITSIKWKSRWSTNWNRRMEKHRLWWRWR